jgi:hypothetical protein
MRRRTDSVAAPTDQGQGIAQELNGHLPTPRSRLSISNWDLDHGEVEGTWPDTLEHNGHHDLRPQSQRGPSVSVAMSPWQCRSEPSPIQNPQSGNTGNQESQIAATFEAQAYIQSELEENARIDPKKRETLQLAITMSSRITSSKDDFVSDPDNLMMGAIDLCDPSMYPSAEAMCFLLSGSILPSLLSIIYQITHFSRIQNRCRCLSLGLGIHHFKGHI